MRRFLIPFLLAGLALFGASEVGDAASTINSLPPIVTSPGVFPLLDPGCPAINSTENLWISQGNGGSNDFRIDPLRLGYIFQGSTAPACPFKYELWWNTAGTLGELEVYTGSTWSPVGWLDSTNNLWIPPVGGGTIPTIASASSTDLCAGGSDPQAIVNVTGSTTITSFGSNCPQGTIKIVNWTNASPPQVTYNATTLILPGAANITPHQNDVWALAYLGSGAWQLYFEQPAAAFSGVTSFNGRSGAVTPQSNDYSFSQISGSVANSQLPTTGAVGSAVNVQSTLALANTSLQVTADSVVVANTLIGTTTSLGSFNKTFNGATTGAGGMDTGALPSSGFVAIYAINGVSGTNILGCATSESGCGGTVYTAANMPNGYTQSALLEIAPTNGTPAMVAGYVRGRTFTYQQAQTALNSSTTNQPSSTSLSVSAILPPTAVSYNPAYLEISTGASATAGQAAVALNTSSVNGSLVCEEAVITVASTNQTWEGGCGPVPVVTAQTIYYQTNGLSGASGIAGSIGINGYSW